MKNNLRPISQDFRKVRSMRDVYIYARYAVDTDFVIFTLMRYGSATLPPQDYSPVPESVVSCSNVLLLCACGI